MNTETKLAECPFCGGAAEVRPYSDLYAARCQDYGEQYCAETRGWRSAEFAIAAWNRRAPAPEARLSEEVKEALFKMEGLGEWWADRAVDFRRLLSERGGMGR